jgi:hypothetical protein
MSTGTYLQSKAIVQLSWREQVTFDEMMIMLSLFSYHGVNKLHLMR